MEPPSTRYKPFSEDKREREVSLLYGAAFRDLPQYDALAQDSEILSTPGNHVAPDSTLTALAQLATFRLHAERAMISLIDRSRQYVLAEATSQTSLHPETSQDRTALWLGNVSIPRSQGMCERVLDIDLEKLGEHEYPVLVVRDLRESTEFASRLYARGRQARSYATAPLLSPAGAIVGSLCIFNNEPQPDGLSLAQKACFRDLARSIMEYLHNYTIKEQYRRGERFTRGLVSFSEGASNLRPFQDISEFKSGSIPSEPLSTASTDLRIAQQEISSPFDLQQRETRKLVHAAKRPKPTRTQSARQLQEDILPLNSRTMFARAANVMMASSFLDGVVILDASVATNKRSQDQSNEEGKAGTTTSGTEVDFSSYSKTSSSDEDGAKSTGTYQRRLPATCQVLGYATPTSDGGADDPESVYWPFAEANLARLLSYYPHGKIFTFGGDGNVLSSTEDGFSSENVTSDPACEAPKRRISRVAKHSRVIHAMLPKARSVAFVPFWDYERSRWFAGCLCWSNDPYRLLSAASDLAHFKVFSHSIMRELSRLDALALNQAKTTFIASISHELRSPLHGILGTLEFIKDTTVDSFQTSMLDSMKACALTLNDTLSHILDHSQINEARKQNSSKSLRSLKNANTVRVSSKPLKNRKKWAGAFDLAIVTEEVVEAVFAESSYISVAGPMLSDVDSASDSGSEGTDKRKPCYIVLDIGPEDDWSVLLPVGLWRRIVMNIFGNAVKFTDVGHVQVSLRTSATRSNETTTTVTLSISDTGSGISPEFLVNKVFEPFSQENSFTSGTGLGLSIVKQIVESTGGKVEISSEPFVGTNITVRLALTKPETPLVTPERAEYLACLPRLAGRRIGILGRDSKLPLHNGNDVQIMEGFTRFSNNLAKTLERHLKMEVVRTSKWDGHDCDIVVVPDVSFEYLAAIRHARSESGRAPVTIFIAMDALEAATLRSSPEVRRKESVVEIMTQPCGPNKLAYIINRCLDRFAEPEENLQGRKSEAYIPQLRTPDVKSDWRRSMRLDASPASDTVFSQRTTPDTSLEEAHVSGDLDPTITSSTSQPSAASLILIVDDNPINRRILIAFMRKHNYRYQEAQNGSEALEAYCHSPSTFSAILMDMSMPVMDGMASTRAIRKHENELGLKRSRIIALTGLASASARFEALSAGVDNFLTKPVNFKALRTLLVKSNERRRASFAKALPSPGLKAPGNEVDNNAEEVIKEDSKHHARFDPEQTPKNEVDLQSIHKLMGKAVHDSTHRSAYQGGKPQDQELSKEIAMDIPEVSITKSAEKTKVDSPIGPEESSSIAAVMPNGISTYSVELPQRNACSTPGGGNEASK